MDMRDREHGSDEPMDHTLALDPRLQDYVDGTLAAKPALRLHLRAQADPDLANEVQRTRAFLAALDTMPTEVPSAGFDARVLATVPLERYRTAPRRPTPVLVLGDLAPAAWWMALRRAGRGATVTAGAYFLSLVVANSALQSVATGLAGSIDRALDAAVERTASVAGLSTLVSAIERGYDAAAVAATGLSGAVGPDFVVFGSGLLVGSVVLASLAARQRRALEGTRP